MFVQASVSEIGHNPYRVLGVDRTADERAIKRAYFGLLREFPPDKHPERFKEIRAAYELLSDAQARQRFDAADRGYQEYPPEIAGRLRLVDEMAVHAPAGHARAALEQLVAEHPEVDLARERLADVCMAEGDFASALAQWEVLAARHPESAPLAFARGVTLGRLGRACDAETALREAVRLAPAEPACRRSLAKVLFDAGRIADALAELDALIAIDDLAPAARLGAELQRARMLVRTGRAEEAFVAIDAIRSRVADGRDREMAELVASAIGAIAATAFAASQPDVANALLARAQTLAPRSPSLRPVAPALHVAFDELPEPSRAVLRGLVPGRGRPVVEGTTWAVPLGGLLLSAAGVGLVWLVAFTLSGPVPWSAAATALAAVAIVLAVVGFGASIRSVLRILASPLRTFWAIVPPYLVAARLERVTLHPLVRLEHASRRSDAPRALRLRFSWSSVGFALESADVAEAWLQTLAQARARALELLEEGCLDAEQGIDLFPPELLAERPPAPRGRRTWLELGALAAVALALVPLAVRYQARRADEASYAEAVGSGTAEAFARHAQAHPRGRFTAAAQRARDRLVRARAAAIEQGAADAPARSALLAALDALGDRKGLPLAVTLGSAAELVAAGVQLVEKPGGITKDAVTSVVLQALAPVVLEAPTPDAPALLSVHGTVATDRRVYRFFEPRASSDAAAQPTALGALAVPALAPAAEPPLPSIHVEWSLCIDVHGRHAYGAERVVAPPGGLAASGRETLAQKIARHALDTLGVWFASQVGVRGAEPARAPSALRMPVGREALGGQP